MPSPPVHLAALLLAPLTVAAAGGGFEGGIGVVDITSTGAVVLAGSPVRVATAEVASRLQVRALVLAAGGRKVAIVALDTLKYPVEHVERARRRIEETTGIPAGHVVLCASHTHRGPLWSHYGDQLVTPIAEAVAIATRDLAPCSLGAAKGRAEGVSECRRVVREGHAWNRWQLAPGEADTYPAEGPADPEFDVLAVTGGDGKLKAIVYNFACHAANTRTSVISADYPGDVERHVRSRPGCDVPVLFLAGACGDVNPVYSAAQGLLGERLGAAVIDCLGRLEPIAGPPLSVEGRELRMPGREHPEFREAEVARNWPGQLEHYRKSFDDMKRREKPAYPFALTGIRIGDRLAIATVPGELFCEIGMAIKTRSPFRHTMVVELANGAHGYIPTAKAFEGGSYETWFGEHSCLTTRAGEIVEMESVDILNNLKRAEMTP